MKKFLVVTLTSILLLIGIVAGSIYYEKYKIEHIVKSDKVKEVVENMLKKQDDKALTPEGKIKSYKIDYNKVEKNPMGGISIDIIINDDEELTIGTIINKYDSRERYDLGVLSFSPKLHKLLYEE